MQLSRTVLAKLSKVSIDPLTLQVGCAIYSNFRLGPIQTIIPYGDIMRFGFEVKHVVTEPAETEEGLPPCCGMRSAVLSQSQL